MPLRFQIATSCIALLLITACASDDAGHHERPMPDPAGYNAHFGDLDTSGDDQVSRDEFKAYFPDADMNVFEAVDADHNGLISHEEWHRFKEAHGMADH